MARSAGVFGLAAGKLHITLLGCLFDDLLSLFESLRMLQPIAVRCAHIIHADSGDSFHARVNFGRTDNKTPAAANPKRTNPFPVNKRSGAKEIYRSTESLGIDIRQNRVAGLSLALSPEGQIQGQSDESLVSQILGIQIRALFLYSTHRMPDNDRGMFWFSSEFLGTKRFPATSMLY